MSNTYSQTLPQHIIRQKVTEVFEDIGAEFEDSTGNLRAQPGIYPDYAAPILRAKPGGGLVLSKVRWGMPSPQKILDGKRTDPGVTNIRNTASPHWRCWLGIEHRCLVPFTGFAEIDARPGVPRNHMFWFALGNPRPLAFLAGVWTEWTSVRKLKEGPVMAELFGFLTCAPNLDVAPIHPKAMPVILTTPAEWRQWLLAATTTALQLQRPLPDGALKIVGEGLREDPF